MAKKTDNEKSNRKVEKQIKQINLELNDITKESKRLVNGIGDDIVDVLENDVKDYQLNVLYSNEEESNKDISSKVSRRKIGNSINASNSIENVDPDSLYDIVNDKKIMSSLELMLGSHNLQFKQLIQDYEIVKRCIPQVYKVIASLCNNISNPDSISRNIIGVKLPNSIKSDVKTKIYDILKDDISPLVTEIINDYLVISVKYFTVVPYSHIADMLSNDTPIQECANMIDKMTEGDIGSLLESSGGVGYKDTGVLSEAAEYVDMDVYKQQHKQFNKSEWIKENEGVVNTILSQTEFVRGGLAHFKNAILNEAVNMRDEAKDNKSMARIYKKLTSTREKVKDNVNVIDGLLSDAAVSDIKKNVNFKGCHVEKLDPTRVVPFKIRDTVIGYFYVTDKLSKNDMDDMKNSGIMEKINSTIYQRATGQDRSQMVERMVIQTVGDRLIKSINSNFLNDNQEDIDKIYEFVRENEIHRKAKRIVFFHPDDVVEFRRKDGSIMKNAIFLAKLLILTTLSNVITNVTKGSDRTMYKVKTGLSTDIGGHVNSAIAAIKQSQIRASDIGTINDVFNIVGSKVDLFLPVSSDGEVPIESEVIPGQPIDMHTDFVEYLVRSIIISFGVPSTVIDMDDQVELAKTLSMSNLDMARMVLDAQLEITDSFTKLLRLIIMYKIPEFEEIDAVEATMNPPVAIMQELNQTLIQDTSTMGDTIAQLLIPEDESETPFATKRRLFKLEYFRRNMRTLDWDEIDSIMNAIEIQAKEDRAKAKLENLGDSDESGDGGDTGNGESF